MASPSAPARRAPEPAPLPGARARPYIASRRISWPKPISSPPPAPPEGARAARSRTGTPPTWRPRSSTPSSLPISVPAVTIDRQCGSSQQAIQFAAQAVMSGTQDVVIAAGVESMTRAPMGLSMVADKGFNPYPQSVTGKYGVPFFSQFIGAEMIADKYGYERARLD